MLTSLIVMKSVKPTRPIHPVWFNHIEPPRWSTWALNTTNALLKVTTIFGTRPLGRDLSFNCEFLLVSIDIHGVSIDTRFTWTKLIIRIHCRSSQALSVDRHNRCVDRHSFDTDKTKPEPCRSTLTVCRSTDARRRNPNMRFSENLFHRITQNRQFHAILGLGNPKHACSKGLQPQKHSKHADPINSCSDTTVGDPMST